MRIFWAKEEPSPVHTAVYDFSVLQDEFFVLVSSPPTSIHSSSPRTQSVQSEETEPVD